MTTTHDDELMETIVSTVPYSDIPDSYNCRHIFNLVREREIAARIGGASEFKDQISSAMPGESKWLSSELYDYVQVVKSQQQDNENNG